MQIRDRIEELVRVPARQLLPNPRNWRTHPAAQRDALRGVLVEIGYASALLARRRDDGRLELIDGHLRAETTPDAHVPVLVLDVTAEEAEKLLASVDPLAAMAGKDDAMLQSLLQRVSTANPAVRAMFDALAETAAASSPPREVREVDIPHSFQVVVECGDEVHQREVYERLTADGLRCRLMML